MLSPDALRAAIAAENIPALTKVPGIGRKGAQKMVIELKDKVNALGAVPTSAAASAPPPAAAVARPGGVRPGVARLVGQGRRRGGRGGRTAARGRTPRWGSVS